MRSVFAVVCVCLCLAAQSSATFRLGKCPTDLKVVSSFDAARYMGRWYEIEAFTQFWELGGRCSTADYTLDEETGRVIVKNSMKIMLGGSVKQEGYAELVDDSGDAKLNVVFDVILFGERQAPYWVLDTDYENYALVYSCKNILPGLRAEYGWILARDPTLSGEPRAAMEEAVKAAGLKRSSFKVTKQNCA